VPIAAALSPARAFATLKQAIEMCAYDSPLPGAGPFLSLAEREGKVVLAPAHSFTLKTRMNTVETRITRIRVRSAMVEA
jgi:hypothetical protein